MQRILLATTAAALVLAGSRSEADAKSRSYHDVGQTKTSRSNRSHKRQYHRYDERFPISVSRPPNTGHYTFQGYPAWAARALEPARTR